MYFLKVSEKGLTIINEVKKKAPVFQAPYYSF
jgi:hypothetical protein